MALADSLKALNEFDLSDLDFDNLGSWPLAVKVIVAVLLFILVVVGGYYYHIEALQKQLESRQAEELDLRRDFEKKAFEAANLEAYKLQMLEMEESFGALVSQLPSDTEVPGLLEDITSKGELNGLAISTIDLLAEVPQEFYIELPIQIVAVGSYHDLGAFVSGMAGLPRIVTLHDFNIKSPGSNTNMLQMNILAKTYRYRDGLQDGP
ncbi:MAG: type 4a pilus biogenesis protein PilO [Cellvibrionales bacterium]|jgi:type IV pilus assembly protein PilO